jgi:hypothetical protein
MGLSPGPDLVRVAANMMFSSMQSKWLLCSLCIAQLQWRLAQSGVSLSHPGALVAP